MINMAEEYDELALFFSLDIFNSLFEYEKTVYRNLMKDYWVQRDHGLSPQPPKFMNKVPVSQDNDEGKGQKEEFMYKTSKGKESPVKDMRDEDSILSIHGEADLSSSPSSRNRTTPGPQRYICRVCGDQLGKERIFRRHVLIHSSLRHLNPHSGCDVCMMPTLRRSRSRKTLRCHVCGKKFGRKHDRQQHLLRNHISIQRVQCEICSEYFDGFDELNMHRDAHLSESRKKVCSTCKTEFIRVTIEATNGDLELTHGEFKCERCSLNVDSYMNGH